MIDCFSIGKRIEIVKENDGDGYSAGERGILE